MKKIYCYILLFVLACAALSGCARKEGSTNDEWSWIIKDEPGSMLPGVDAQVVSGDVVIAGSSTVFPLMERLATRFRQEGYADSLTIDSIGSGGGFERFSVQAETDITMASRPIKNEEREAAIHKARLPIEFRIGTDALAVVVHPENTWLQSPSVKELSLIFTSDTWSSVNSAWPDLPILKFIPGTDSGTFDYFVEAVYDKDPEELLDAEYLQLSEDDNILVRGVAGNKNAIAFFGYAYYIENSDIVRAIDIEGITASNESVDNNSYPLARPLFLYSAANIMREKPAVAAFLNFVLTNVDREVSDVGYFPAPETVMNQSREAWLRAVEDMY